MGPIAGSFQGSAAGGGGSVTAVTGVAPIASTGGATPAISIAAATSAALGAVKPDGTIITVAAGAITVPKASASVFGVVEVDGTTITASGGVISSVGGGGGGPTTQNSVTGSRSIGTVFQNTSGKTMWVNVIATIAPNAGVQANTDSSNPPTTPVAAFFNGNFPTSNVTLSFIVLSGNFYELINISSAATLVIWVEWT